MPSQPFEPLLYLGAGGAAREQAAVPLEQLQVLAAEPAHEGRYKVIWKREFNPPWRKAGLLNSSRCVSGFGPGGCQERSLVVPAQGIEWFTHYRGT